MGKAIYIKGSDYCVCITGKAVALFMPTAAAVATAAAAEEAAAVAACATSAFEVAHAVVDDGAENQHAGDDGVVGVAFHPGLRSVVIIVFEDVVPVAPFAEAGEADDGGESDKEGYAGSRRCPSSARREC